MCRQANAENSKVRFFGAIDDPDLYAWPAPLKLTALGAQRLKEFRPAMTLMRIMCNDALVCSTLFLNCKSTESQGQFSLKVKRHWKEMSQIAGFDLTPNAGTSLRKITMMGLEADLDKYDVIR